MLFQRMRVPERLPTTTVSDRQYRTRASDRGRTADGSGDAGPNCPGSLIVVSNRQPYRHTYDKDDEMVPVDEFVEKPVEPAKLVEIVKKHLK